MSSFILLLRTKVRTEDSRSSNTRITKLLPWREESSCPVESSSGDIRSLLTGLSQKSKLMKGKNNSPVYGLNGFKCDGNGENSLRQKSDAPHE